jgi:hypothetical protein
MADHRSQYPMGHSFVQGAPGMMQQHQLNAMQQQQQLQQQSGQQQQDSSQQPHPGMAGFPDQRIWSQMQHMQQMRNQNGQDMNAPSSQQQMADLMRSQSMAQLQSQQQRFGGLGLGGPNSGQQTPHNMQMSFTNMEPSYQPIQHRQNMLQALQGNQQHTRQLELMVTAQNQQNQNGPTNLGNRVTSGVPMNNGPGPAGLNPMQSQNDMFSNPNDMRRPSPHPPLQPNLLGNQQPNPNGMTQNPRGTTLQVQGRTINLADLTERAATLRNMIQNQEMQLRQLQTQRTGMPDNVFMARMRSLQGDINNRKESLNKIITLTNICIQQNNGGAISNIGPSPNGGPPPGSNGQPWQTSPFGNNAQGSSQPQPTRSSPAPPHPQAGHPISSPNNVPPRTVPTPQQAMNPFPNLTSSPLNLPMNNTSATVAPGLSNLGPNVPAPIHPTVIAPLDKQRFDTSYKQWCLTKNIVHDPRLLSIDNRPIDLFQLHCHVMREGGIQNVTRKELWPVIGGRLGVVHFPGTTNEPPKSGPGAAIHLQQVYKEYLSAFDTVYMASVMDSRRKTNQLPSQFPPQALSFPEIVRSFNPNQLRMIIACADKGAAELRARGMSESMVSFIENHRASLQGMAVDQENFSNDLRRTQPSAGMGGGLVGQPPFPNPNIPVNPGQPPFTRPPGELQPSFQPGLIPRPTREQLGVAHVNINRLKIDYTARVIPMMPPVEIPPANRAEYSNMLDIVCRLANDLENRLAVFNVVTKNEEGTRKILSAIISVQHQRSLLASPNPKFIVSFDTLRMFYTQLQNMARQIQLIVQNMIKPGEHPSGPGDQHVVPPHTSPPPPPQLPPASQVRPPPHPNPPPLKNNKVPPQKGVVSTPTPPASAATPVPTAPTPTAAAASPPTPKSPKVKPVTKKKPVTRKPSTKTPTLEPATIPTPPSTGVKRQREEEPESSQPTPGPSSGPNSNPMPPVVSEPSPPKRAKTDWEGPISQSLQKKNQAVENIKTEEDASQFLEQMTELIKMAPSEEQASLSSDISDTLEQILRGYGGAPDSDANTFSSLGLVEVGGSMEASTSQLPQNDLTEFFDFSLFPNEEEYESKVGTPDLISSSSTNPSPESQADADPAHHATALLDIKQEEYDPLRLGGLKEIDGGESAYYQSTDWKWDGQMATLEQPWAIFNS